MKKIILVTCFLGLTLLAFGQIPRLVVPIGNTKAISSTAFSPDGKYILSGNGDMMIGDCVAILWDRQGREIQTFKGHTSVITKVAFFPDGKRVLTGSWDGTAKVWDLQGKVLQTFKNTDNISALAISPDGKLILVGDNDGARLWDLQGKVVRTLAGVKEVQSVAFSADGTQLLTSNGGTSPLLKLWSLQGQLIRSFAPGKEDTEIYGVFSPDGKQILSIGSYAIAKLWDVQGNLIRELFDKGSFAPSAFCFSPDGKKVLRGFRNGGVILSDLQGETLFSLQRESWVRTVQFSPDGQHVLVGWDDGKMELLDLQGQPTQNFRGHTSTSMDMAYAPDGQHLLLGGSDHTARLWDLQRQEIKSLPGHEENWVASVAYSADGQQILTKGGRDAFLRNAAGQTIRTYSGPRFGLNRAVFIADGQVMGTGDNFIKVWNAQGVETKSTEVNFNTYHPEGFAKNGQFMLTSNNQGGMRMLDREGKVLHMLNSDAGSMRAFGIFPDDQQIIIVDNTNKATIWNAEGQKIRSFQVAVKMLELIGARYLAISPDGQMVASIGDNYVINLWDLQGRVLQTFKGHTGIINTLRFSPDGKQLMSSSMDTTVKLWDTQTGKELATLLTIDATDWVVTTPSGLFDASPGAMNLMYFVVGLEVVALEQLKERYYEPGLLPRLMGLSSGTIREVSTLTAAPLYPEINASIDNDQLTIQLTPRSGGLGKLSFFINGKEMAENLNTGSKTSLTVDLKAYDKFYLPGSNTLTIRAYNSDNWLKSPAYDLDYAGPAASKGTGTGSTPSTPTTNIPKPHLYAIVVGTSDYSGTQLDLRFPDHDATTISQALSSAGKALFEDRVHVKLLTTDSKTPTGIASKTNIAAAFTEFAGLAKPTDVLVIYFSGHGISYGNAEQSQFYYLTKDIASADLSDPEVRKKATVSSEDLTAWLTAITAQKQVMIFDACNSGKVVDAFSGIGARSLNSTQIRALDRMKDRTGMFILTGAAADKVSFEASQYGQGLLTYSLLQGMSGLALTSDKRVDVMTLMQYARDQVPELAKGIRQVQIPVVAFPANGGSFDIGIVNAGVKIPLAQVKPVFIRNVFQDEDTFDDVLGLTNALAGYFEEITTRGAQADMIYVDVSEYENAYSIKGRYTLKGDVVTVRGRLFQGTTSKGEFTLTGKKSQLSALVAAIVDKVSEML
ncbi:MAG: caspase family protein [Lewinellaceae bacterium]|nr:caspase family protein [Lewinellaceae bacterium]